MKDNDCRHGGGRKYLYGAGFLTDVNVSLRGSEGRSSLWSWRKKFPNMAEGREGLAVFVESASPAAATSVVCLQRSVVVEALEGSEEG